MTQMFLQNVISKDFILLDSSQTVAETITLLQQKPTNYGVAVGRQSDLPASVAVDMLQKAPDQQAMIGDWVDTLARPAPIFVDLQLDQVVVLFQKVLLKNRQLAGLVVWDEQQKIVGVLPRKIISLAAGRMMERGGEVGSTKGLPILSSAIIFYCAIDHEEQSVSYYDPDQHPRCSKGHPMRRKPLG